MRRRRILWQIYIPMLLGIIICVTGSTWYAARTVRGFYLDQTQADLLSRAVLLRPMLAPAFAAGNYPQLIAQCKELGRETATRITVILASGEVVADSAEDAGVMDNHAGRAEVVQALNGRTGTAIRSSHTINRELLYLAIPFAAPPAPGVLRLSIPVTDIDQALSRVVSRIVLISLALVLAAAVIILSVSRRITRPLEKIRSYAERLSRGELGRQIDLGEDRNISLEVAELAGAIDRMARQLNERFQAVSRQRNELEGVFSSMVEAVIVVAWNEKILSMNKAATRFLGVSSADVGRPVAEVFSSAELVQLIRRILKERNPLEAEVLLEQGGNEIVVQTHGTILLDAGGSSAGALIVLHDISRLRGLENIRRDLVANVSHELKTPITAIKGFVETLQDGATSPEDARRFINIILKHTERLNAIVDDLLTLARIEQGEEQEEIAMAEEPVRDLMLNVIETCSQKAREKDITIKLDARMGIVATVNGQLLEQAVVNLVVNAIAYSHEHGEISINVVQDETGVQIRVEDFGVGIAREHLPRLFERFYRSDRARSRKHGGTGLGLAIVKHIIQLHNGTVSVDSDPGRGAVFTLHIPR